MDVKEFKLRALHGLIRPRYFYIPVKTEEEGYATIIIRVLDDNDEPVNIGNLSFSVSSYTYPYDYTWNEEHTQVINIKYTDYNDTYVFDDDYNWIIPMSEEEINNHKVSKPNMQNSGTYVVDMDESRSYVYDTYANFYFTDRNEIVIKNVPVGVYNFYVYVSSTNTKNISLLEYATGHYDGLYEDKPWTINYTNNPRLQINKNKELTEIAEWYYADSETHLTTSIDFYSIKRPFESNIFPITAILRRCELNITIKIVDPNVEDIVNAEGYTNSKYRRDWNVGDYPDYVDDYSYAITCNVEAGMRHIRTAGTISGTSTLKSVMWGHPSVDNGINITGLEAGNYTIYETSDSIYTVCADHVRRRGTNYVEDLSNLFRDSGVELSNTYRNVGKGNSEAIVYDSSKRFNVSFTIVEDDGSYEIKTGGEYLILLNNARIVDNKAEQIYGYLSYDYDYYQIANDNSCYIHTYGNLNSSAKYQKIYIIRRPPVVKFEACWFDKNDMDYWTYSTLHSSINISDLSRAERIRSLAQYCRTGMQTYQTKSYGTFVQYDGFPKGVEWMAIENDDVWLAIARNECFEFYKPHIKNNVKLTSRKVTGLKIYVDGKYVGSVIHSNSKASQAYALDGRHKIVYNETIATSPSNASIDVSDYSWTRYGRSVTTPSDWDGKTDVYDIIGEWSEWEHRENEMKADEPENYKPTICRIVRSSFDNLKIVNPSNPNQYNSFYIESGYTENGDYQGVVVNPHNNRIDLNTIYTFKDCELVGNYSYTPDSSSRQIITTEYKSDEAKIPYILGDGLNEAMYAACCLAPIYELTISEDRYVDR